MACDQVTVTTPDAVSLDLDPTDLNLEVGERTQISVTVRDANGNQLGGLPITWASANSGIASVSNAGFVEGAGVGTTTITATSGDASGSARVVVRSAAGFALDRTSVSFLTGVNGTAGPENVLISGIGTGGAQGLTATTQYTGAGSGWLNAALSSLDTPSSLALTANAQGLATGTYAATVVVAAPGLPNQSVSVSLQVTGAPAQIVLSPSTLAFSAIRGGANPSPQSVTVTNTGEEALSGLSVSATGYTGGASGWANPSLSGTTAPTSLTVAPQTTGLAPGGHSVSLQVSSPAATNSPQTVTVNVAVPGIALSTSNLNVSVGVGGSTSRQVNITNAGVGSLSGYAGAVNYTSGGTGWLTTSFSANRMTLGLSAAGLTAGTTHRATVAVTAAEDVIGAQLTVTMTVTAPPAIGLSTTSVALLDTGPTSAPATGSISVANTGAGTLDGLSAAVSYSGGGSGWLAASLSSSTAPATVALTATPGSLAPGTYNATVTVASSSSGVNNNPSQATVTFTVGPRPTIALSPTAVGFSTSQGGPNPSGSSVSVTNSGTGTLDGLATSVSYGAGATGWLGASLTGTTAPASINLNATTGALAQGTYSATVTVTSSAGRVTNSPQTVTVTFTVTQPPAIGLSPTSLSFTGFAGGTPPAGQTVSVTNAGGGTLSALSVDSIVYGSGSGWLSATLAGSTAPATLTATADPGSLAVGTYAATIYVGSTASGVTNSPQAVSVSFNVQQPPTIVLGSTAEAHVVTEAPGAPSTASTTVAVTDAGTSVPGLGTSISYTTGTGWLSASLNSTTTPSTLTLQSSAGALAPGTYTATVNVTSGVAGNSPQSVGVTLTVQNAPSIQLTGADPMLFTDVVGGSNPATQNVSIANAGGGGNGGLTGLAAGISYLTPGGPGVGSECTHAATGWLAATPSPTTSPSTMTVQATTGALTSGVYCARVKVTSPVARNSEPFAGTSPDFLVRFTIP